MKSGRRRSSYSRVFQLWITAFKLDWLTERDWKLGSELVLCLLEVVEICTTLIGVDCVVEEATTGRTDRATLTGRTRCRKIKMTLESI